MNVVQCSECEAILTEFRRALDEMPPALRDQYWADRDAFMSMIGGTEEEVQHLEQSGGKFQFPFYGSGAHRLSEGRYPRVHMAFRKMFEHRFRSGHGIVRILFMK